LRPPRTAENEVDRWLDMLRFRLLGAVGPNILGVNMRVWVILMLSGTLGLLGCGSTSSNTGGSGGNGGSAGAGGGEGGSGGEAGMAGEGGAGGEGGEGGAGGGSAAQDFCALYDTTCGYGGADRYADEGACLDAYENSGQSACYEMHLGFAIDMDDPATHCPHATGIGQCTS
jgi:hypothetical protein